MRKSKLLLGIMAALCLGGALLSGARAAVWRLATDQALDSPEGAAYKHFADLVAKYSNGALTIQIFPNSQLGQEDAVLEQLSAGVVQMFPDAMSAGQKWVPDMTYLGAPFLFADRDHWKRFVHADLAQGWFKQIHDNAGIDVIGDPTAFLRGPYRVIVSKKPIASINDLNGLKLRLAKDQLTVDAWHYLGADVRILDFSQIYDGLDRNLIDAFNSPVAQLESTRAYEVAKNVARTNEYWQSVAFFVNARAYEGLSPDLKAAVDRAFTESADYVGTTTDQYLSASLDRMKKANVIFTDFDTKPVVAKMQEFYAGLSKSGKLPKGFLDTVNATR